MQKHFFSPPDSLTASGVSPSLLWFIFETATGLKVPQPSHARPLLVATWTSPISVSFIAPPTLTSTPLNALRIRPRIGKTSLSATTPLTPKHRLCVILLLLRRLSAVASSFSMKPGLHPIRLRGSLLQALLSFRGSTFILSLMYLSSRTNPFLLWRFLRRWLLSLLRFLINLPLFLLVYTQMRLPFFSVALQTLAPVANSVLSPSPLLPPFPYPTTSSLQLLFFLSSSPLLTRRPSRAPKRQKWLLATEKDFSSLSLKGTWHLVPLVSPLRVIGCSWKVKRDSSGSILKYKARLVARGDMQDLDYSFVFAPIARYTTHSSSFSCTCLLS